MSPSAAVRVFRANGPLSGRVHVTALGAETAGPPVIFVHGSTAWGDDPVFGFAAQRPLAGRFRLLLVDRRGYGDSPDAGEAFAGDYLADADDIAELLGDGAHLVGHSYGGVGVMLAAARRPEAVRSLTLIEPGCYQAAADDPAVAAALRANRAAYADLPQMTPEQWLRAVAGSTGMPPLEPTPRRLRAVSTAMRERVCWEAGIPLPALNAAAFPKLVVSGTWETAPAPYREHGGVPLMACARITADRIGARHVSVPGAAHYPHVDAPAELNALLAGFWTAAVP
ncbi:alpha/beta fold hydrolase [Thermomonospora cellulosilytica]|uniref:Pimeloyl-ACP methyl ester carboxylesterase n=1 Tax=Thermomonospora cellulosilytica TaxID=1411118 RepID=A0A7W3MXA2_9ACTN|nr:alpha/beta hydrolase [Thermomonospora cellulosilytica]MBA9003597.1 pimeloyl-ACP methyl ester carboxylesterase [Thermomonospora cellulosilytica]